MSRLDGKKGFSCITNCLPTKSRLGKAMTDTNKSKAPSFAPEYGASTLDVNDSYFNGDEAKYEQTKHWLQNLSAVANYEPTSPSFLEESEATLVETEQSYRKPCSCCHDKCRKRPSSRCGRHFDDSDSVSRAKSKYGHSHACEKKGKSCDDSCLSDMKPNCDECSFLSSKICDNSLVSSKCCSHHKRKRRMCANSTLRNAETSSVTSGASSVSLATQLVTLNMDECKHLGITIVGHSNPQQGDCGIFVGSVKKDGAAALNGHIEPGDLILEVNGIDLEPMTNEHALVTLKTHLAKGGIIQILIAKYWDMDPNDNLENHCYSEQLYDPCGSVHSVAASVCSRQTASRPSYPQRQTDFQRPNALQSIPEDGRMRQFFQASGMSILEPEKVQSLTRGTASLMPPLSMIPPAHSGKAYFSSSSSVHTSLPDSGFHDVQATGFGALPMAHGMFSAPSRGSTLDRRFQAAAAQAHGAAAPSDPAASWHPFLGADLINWIRGQANNMFDRRDAHVYAQNLLQSGYICNADFRQSMQFHESHYYVFGQNPSLGTKRMA